MRWALAAGLLFLCALSWHTVHARAAFRAADVAPQIVAQLDSATCHQNYHSDCNYWIGRWIQTLPVYAEFRHSLQPTTAQSVDAFYYNGRVLGEWTGRLEGGTWFTYGKAGPPKGHIL